MDTNTHHLYIIKQLTYNNYYFKVNRYSQLPLWIRILILMSTNNTHYLYSLFIIRNEPAMNATNGAADIIRWEILQNYGEIFIDADSICIEPFDS